MMLSKRIFNDSDLFLSLMSKRPKSRSISMSFHNLAEVVHDIKSIKESWWAMDIDSIYDIGECGC